MEDLLNKPSEEDYSYGSSEKNDSGQMGSVIVVAEKWMNTFPLSNDRRRDSVLDDFIGIDSAGYERIDSDDEGVIPAPALTRSYSAGDEDILRRLAAHNNAGATKFRCHSKKVDYNISEKVLASSRARAEGSNCSVMSVEPVDEANDYFSNFSSPSDCDVYLHGVPPKGDANDSTWFSAPVCAQQFHNFAEGILSHSIREVNVRKRLPAIVKPQAMNLPPLELKEVNAISGDPLSYNMRQAVRMLEPPRRPTWTKSTPDMKESRRGIAVDSRHQRITRIAPLEKSSNADYREKQPESIGSNRMMRLAQRKAAAVGAGVNFSTYHQASKETLILHSMEDLLTVMPQGSCAVGFAAPQVKGRQIASHTLPGIVCSSGDQVLFVPKKGKTFAITEQNVRSLQISSFDQRCVVEGIPSKFMASA